MLVGWSLTLMNINDNKFGYTLILPSTTNTVIFLDETLASLHGNNKKSLEHKDL